MTDSQELLSNRSPSAGELAEIIIRGEYDNDLMAFRIEELANRGETIEDVTEMVAAFREVMIPVSTTHSVVADLCGTGGASFRTFNVSTCASFILSAAGIPVAKHGNRSQNGRCGSADVIESLGGRILTTSEETESMLDRLGLSFLYAPCFHPALRNAAPIRRRLKRRTIFNMIGPLLNPITSRKRHLLGVYDSRLLDLLPPILDAVGIERAMIVHGHPGMDEVSTLGPTKVVEVRGCSIERYEIYPSDYGIQTASSEALAEMAPPDAAKAAHGIFSGDEGPLRDLVAINSACAMRIFGLVSDIEQGLRLAERTIDSGRAIRMLDQFVQMSRSMGT